MTITRYLLVFCLGGLLLDACYDGKSSDTKTQTAALITNVNRAGQTNLCDPGERNYVLPTLGLPNPATIPNSNIDSVLIAYLQNRADKLSWMTFIAMNWRANRNGTPDSTQCFGSRDGTTVWEHWMPGRELFRSDSQPPRPWQYGLSAKGHPKNSTDEPKFRNFKLNELDQFDADRQVVPNQSGFNTLYEVFYSRQVYDYIVGGGLYSVAGQRQFVKKWPKQTNGLYWINADKRTDTMSLEELRKRAYLPLGSPKDTSFTFSTDGKEGQLYFYENIGSIMVKSAWTVLTPAQDAAQYHIRTVRMNGKQVTLGLVSLHIAHKLAEAPRWMWSTFEHVKNAPIVDKRGVATLKPGVNYLYFDKTSNDPSTYNKPPDGQQRVQVVRMQQSTKSTNQINNQFHAIIRQANKKSVWLNYRLVGTQWPFNNPDPLAVEGSTQPALLANAMLETYHQSTSSCMACHSKARFLKDPQGNGNGYFADFMWGLALGTDSRKKMHKYAN